MRVLTQDDVSQAPIKAALIAGPKKGKTSLATDLPWGPFWGEEAVYVAWDPGSADLKSTKAENRHRIHVIIPEAEHIVVPGKPTKLRFNPLEEACAIASRDWTEQFPKVKTLIWDTMTITSQDLLAAVAANGLYVGGTSKPMAMGKENTESFVVHPNQGDYGMAQRQVLHILGFLVKHQPKLNVIVLFHEDEDDKDGKADMVGGPATIGKAGIRPVASLFDNLFRLAIVQDRDTTVRPPKITTRRVVYTEPRGYWLGGIRVPPGMNTLPEIELTQNGCDFWNSITNLMQNTKGVAA